MLYDKKWDEKLPVDNFLSAEELKIPDQERQDLIQVLGMFERGEIPSRLFNMGHTGKPECGIPGCILGWCYTFNKYTFAGSLELTGLFWPVWRGATPAQAGKAVRNFLTTGDHKWEEILHVV